MPAGGPGLSGGTCLGPTDGEGLIMRAVNGKYGDRMVFCAVRNAYQGDIPVPDPAHNHLFESLARSSEPSIVAH